MLRLVAAYLLACALVSTSAFAADKSTVASTSLCGDSYVLALMPERINALSWQSRDALSSATQAQKFLPQIWDDPEVLLQSDAELIVFGPSEGTFSEHLSQKTQKLEWGENFGSVITNSERLNPASDYPRALKARLEKLGIRAASRTRKPKVLYLSRSGGTAGPGTYVDAAITAAGGTNVVTSPSWFTPDPEEILIYDPDIILTSFFTDGYESVQSNGIRHAALQGFIKSRARIDIPGKLWPCAGPGLIDAAELIADALDELP